MKTIIQISFLLIPAFIGSQTVSPISYQQGLDNCRKIGEEKHKLNPDHFPYVPPDCIIRAQLPDLSMSTMDGKEISNDFFQGKLTILNFWTISCPPCIAEIPGLNHVMDTYGHEHFNYLAICPDTEKDIRGLLKNNPWGFAQIPQAMDVILDTFNARWGYPTTFVINKNGVIIAAFAGGYSDERAVKEIEDTLGEIIAAAQK